MTAINHSSTDHARLGHNIAARAALMAASLFAFLIPASAQEASIFETIRTLDTQVASIGYRLATANAPLCDQLEPGLGLVLHMADQYAHEMREAALQHFRFETSIGVEAIIPHSPAALAGIQQDDNLIAINKIDFGLADLHADASTVQIIAAYRQIIALAPDQPLTLKLRRDGVDQVQRVTPIPACRSRFELVIRNDFLAQADGELVQISSRFLTDYPHWVAAPLAHELAHNILRHRERLEAKGVKYGLLSGFGRNVRYFRQAELEADILSISLLANAGYDPQIALDFWQDFGPSHLGSMLRSRTHPGWKTRLEVMKQAIADLGQQRPFYPDILAARKRSLDGQWRLLLPQKH